MTIANLAQPQWTPDEDATLRNMAGLASPEQIGARTGRTPKAVKERARALGIRLCTGGPRARFAPVVKARALSMLAAGQTLRATAEAVGASFVTVWRWKQQAEGSA